MENEKQEIDFDLFNYHSKSRGLEMWRSATNPDYFLICTPYCRWIGIEKRTGKLTKYEGDLLWESIGKISPSATDKERIAFYMSNLPSTDWTIDLNFAQLCEWLIHRTWAIRIAKCFLAGHNQLDNPTDWEFNEGTIDEYQKDYTWLLADRYENLWKLLTRKEKKIEAALRERKNWGYPFVDCHELFQEIVKPLVEENFLKCFQRNYINRPREIKNLATLSRHHLNGKNLSEAQVEKLSNLTKKYRPQNPWYERVIQVSANLAESDDVIRAYLQVNNALNDALLAMEQKAQSDPSFNLHAEKSYAWRGGQRHPT